MERRRLSGETIRVRLAVAPAALILAALVGCAAGEAERRTTSSSTRPPSPAPPAALPPEPAAARLTPSCKAGTRRALGDVRTAYAAVALRPTRAFLAPGRRPLASFGLRNVNGHATVFGVLGSVVAGDCSPAWYRVQLPLRPNGVTGYVRAADVEVERILGRIVVDLSARRLTFFRSGRPVLQARVAIGAPQTPTPTGRFYVDQRLIPGDPGGPWGPAAIGISAHSDVLQSWAQGGPIAIHGTNVPSSIGRAASNGCIRLDDATLRRLFARTPAGTPVIIRA